MNLEKGNKSNPSGNLILYCHVIGENPIPPGGKIIASNVVVSFLKHGDQMPVVTFPPVAFKTVEDLQKIISENYKTYDVAKLPDFEFPQNQNKANDYMQERLEQFNQTVMRYVELCKLREEKPHVEIPDDPAIQKYIDALTELSMEYRNSQGLAKEATAIRMDRLVHNFSIHHPEYDLENFKRALQYPGSQGDELVGLYLKKFNAISIENYEFASALKKRINEIEST